MKKLLFSVAIAGLTFACNDAPKSSSSTTDTTAAASATTSAATDSSATAAQPALKDSLMTLKDGKMMIVKNGAWVALDAEVTCTNGRKVSVDGTVSKKDKKRRTRRRLFLIHTLTAFFQFPT